MYHPQQSTEEQPQAVFYNDGISLEHLLHWFIVSFPFCSDHNLCHWGHITWFVSNRKKVFENCWQRQKEVCKGCEFPGSLCYFQSICQLKTRGASWLKNVQISRFRAKCVRIGANGKFRQKALLRSVMNRSSLTFFVHFFFTIGVEYEYSHFSTHRYRYQLLVKAITHYRFTLI